MALNPSAQYSITLLDASNEESTTTINVPVGTAGNFAAQATLRDNYNTALLAVTLGNVTRKGFLAVNTKVSAAIPTDADAQRERKWLVRYEDIVNLAIFKVEIPTAMLEDGVGVPWLLPGTDIVDIAITEVAAFITAFEALAVSPDGNGVNVIEIIAVGRSI